MPEQHMQPQPIPAHLLRRCLRGGQLLLEVRHLLGQVRTLLGRTRGLGSLLLLQRRQLAVGGGRGGAA